jgi:hypothetical protein
MTRETEGVGTHAGAAPRRWFLSRVIALQLVSAFFLIGSAPSEGSELKPETLKAWKEYIDARSSRLVERSKPEGEFLWTDKTADRGRRVRRGEIMVSSAIADSPKRVASGLIHDWIWASYFPNAKLQKVLAVVRPATVAEMAEAVRGSASSRDAPALFAFCPLIATTIGRRPRHAPRSRRGPGFRRAFARTFEKVTAANLSATVYEILFRSLPALVTLTGRTVAHVGRKAVHR